LTVALLAVLKSGAAYVPLDPEYPARRLEYMIADAGVEILITRTELRRNIPRSDARELCLDTERDAIEAQDCSNPEVEVLPEQIAYVNYTSGSTGQPKGVMGLHRATINRFAWMYEQYPFEPNEVCCARASLNFVDSIWELFGPLLKGVPTVLLPTTDRHHLAEFVHPLVQHGVTRLVLVPSLLRALLEAHTEGHLAMPELKYWITSGESLPGALAGEFRSRFPNARLINLYGSSEDAADVTHHELQTVSEPWVPIGRPVANTRVYILDRDLTPVPVGVPGEIYVAGDSLARGYLNRPDMTAEKFLADPFDGAGSRMYRTGDLGRFLPDGTIGFLGRSDHQVKIRGHRIETGEVETALQSHPRIRQAVVTAAAAAGGKVLVAYFVADGQTPESSELREFLKQSLPSYMVPSFFLELAQFPLLPNGKVDRAALPSPAAVTSAAGTGPPVPTTEMENKIADIWKKLLDIPALGPEDNFFDLGGHSLQIMRMRTDLKRAIGRDVAVVDLFMHPTVRSLARFLGEGHRDAFSIANILRRAELRRDYFTRIQQEIERRVDL
jgi:amino acid adenylation domain-containing protein